MGRKVKRNLDSMVVLVCLGMLVFSLANMGYAQAEPEPHTIVPEPASLALISTGGILGYLARFARKRFREFKRGFDVVVSIVALMLASPIIAIAALVIKIVSPGPVLYKQERVGRGGRIFNLYKLRTMKVNAEEATGPVWAKEGDPRLIKFGKIIRKAHIDELPQLVNVLKGEMSLVGPRPERPIFVQNLDKQIANYRKRLLVQPGITGLAQVWHKYDETIEDVKKKIKLDLLYIRRMCLWVDVRILALTVVAVLTGRGAR